MEEDYTKEIKCSNGKENHHTFSRRCRLYKRIVKIMEVKFRRNITFLETTKIMESYTKGNKKPKQMFMPL